MKFKIGLNSLAAYGVWHPNSWGPNNLSRLIFCLSVACSTVSHATSQEAMHADMLSLDQARSYMVTLINRDRMSNGLKPVVIDPVATAAGQIHTDEMVRTGFGGHYDPAGHKPDQRYTDAGGRCAVFENAWYYRTGAEMGSFKNEGENHFNRRLAPPIVVPPEKPSFNRRYLDKIESDFFNESPPHDSHRQLILDPAHNGVGIGLSQIWNEHDGYRIACAQEFTNNYGRFAKIPRSMSGKQTILVEGTLNPGLQLKSILVRREPLPKPMTVEQLNQLKSYDLPKDFTLAFFPPPYSSPAPVLVRARNGGTEFSLRILPASKWEPGIYYVEVWAHRKPDIADFVASERTVVCTSYK